MADLAAILSTAIGPALSVLPAQMDSVESRVMLLAIGLQESQLTDRVQKPNGPAHGLWMFEPTGVGAVLSCPATVSYARNVCDALGVLRSTLRIYNEIEHDDILAAAFARLLLWSDPKPLPARGAMGSAWDYYVRNWEPGKPRPTDWPANYRAAVATVQPQQAAA